MIVMEILYFTLWRKIRLSETFPIVIDIETANLGPNNTGGIVNPKDWTIACVGVYDSLTNERYVFIPFEEIVLFSHDESVNSQSFARLKSDLIKTTNADYILPIYPSSYGLGSLASALNHWASKNRYFLTHRGHTFDWPILSHYLGTQDLYASLKLKGYLLDTHAYIEQQTGHNCGLNALIISCLGPSNEKTLKGKDAPKIWTDGVKAYQSNLDSSKLSLVIDYCIGDVVKTYGVFKFGLENEVIEVVPYGVECKVSVPITSWGVNL